MPSLYDACPRLPRRFRLVLSSFAQQEGLAFAQVLPEETIAQAFADADAAFAQDADDIYTPALTLWAFLSQVLCSGVMRSCRAAVARVLVLWVTLGKAPFSDNTGGYCRARAKLPVGVLRRLTTEQARGCEQRLPRRWWWKGRHVQLVDGTTVSMPASANNQAAYPQPATQAQGLGFPIARLVVLWSLATAMTRCMALGPYRGKETGETALLRELFASLEAGDVLLGDRYFCSYFMVALLQERGLDFVVRLHQRRHSDFRRGRHLGRGDHVVTWSKPEQPDWMDDATYQRMPATLQVREVYVKVQQPGFRTESLVVVTTLTDAQQYRRDDVAELYHQRWLIEGHHLDRYPAALLALAHAQPLNSEVLWDARFQYNEGPDGPWFRLLNQPETDQHPEILRTITTHSVVYAVTCLEINGVPHTLTGDDAGFLHLWNLADGALVREFRGHSGSVNDVAVTADGLAVSASDDSTLRVWELASGVCRCILQRHTASVLRVAVNADGLAVSKSLDNTLRFWDLRKRTCLRNFQNWWTCVFALTADGYTVVGPIYGRLGVWDLKSGACRFLEGHTRPVNAVAVTADGLAVSASDDNTLRVWELASGVCRWTLPGHTAPVDAIAVTSDGLAVSASLWDTTLRVWDLKNGVCLRTFQGHTDKIMKVMAVAATADGVAVSTSDVKKLCVWDLRRKSPLPQGHTDRVNSVAVTADGRAVSTSEDGTLRVWDSGRGVCRRVLPGQEGRVNAVAVTTDGLAVSGSDHGLHVWELDTGVCRFSVNQGDVEYVYAVAVTADGLVVSGSDNGTLRVYKLGGVCRMLDGHPEPINAVAVTANGFAVSASDDGTLRVWELAPHVSAPVGYWEQKHEVLSGLCRSVLRGHTGRVNAVAVMTNGLAVSASDDGTLRVWELGNGNCQGVIQCAKANAVAVTADGLAVSASDDGTLRVWDLVSGQCRAIFPHDYSFTSVSITPHPPHTVVAGDVLGNVLFFRIENLEGV
jgi:WD40 repeat protein